MQEEMKKLIEDIDSYIKNNMVDELGSPIRLSRRGQETLINKGINEKLFSEENVNSEVFETSANAVKEKIDENIKALKEADKNRKAILEAAGDAFLANPLIIQLENISKRLGEKSEAIVDAISQANNLDIDDYIEKQNEVLDDLKSDRDSKKSEYEAANKEWKAYENLQSKKNIDKLKYTIKKFEEYDKTIRDISAARSATPVNAEKVAKLEEKLKGIKTEIQDKDKCFKISDDITAEKNGINFGKFKDAFEHNRPIGAFIDGNLKDASGATVRNLKESTEKRFEFLKQSLKNEPDFANVRNVASKLGITDIENMDENTYNRLMKEVEKNKDAKENSYEAARKVVKSREKDITSIKDKQSDLGKLSTSKRKEDIDKGWTVIPVAEQTALLDRSNSWRSRFEFWRQDASRGRISSFFNAFRKEKTVREMKYNKIISRRNAIEKENKNRSNKFKKELVSKAKQKGQKIEAADRNKVMRTMNESEVIKDQEER